MFPQHAAEPQAQNSVKHITVRDEAASTEQRKTHCSARRSRKHRQHVIH